MLNPKNVNLKMYALQIESERSLFLSVQQAVSLEEAFALAKFEFEKQNPQLPLQNFKIGLFSIKSNRELTAMRNVFFDKVHEKKSAIEDLQAVADIFKVFSSMEVEDISPLGKKFERALKKEPEILDNTPKDKNALMSTIIQNKDKSLFKKNKKLFTKSEVKYIEARIK